MMTRFLGWFAWRDVKAGWIDYQRTARLRANSTIPVRLTIRCALDYRIGWTMAWLLRRP